MLSRRCCMNIFIAGATGAVGRALIPQLDRTRTRRHRHHPLARQGRRAARARRHAGRRRRPRPRRPCISAVRGRRARRDRPPDDRAGGPGRPAPVRAGVRHDQPAAHRGHRHTCSPPRARSARPSSRSPSRAGRYEPIGGPVKDEDAPLMADPPKQLRTTHRGDPPHRARSCPPRAAWSCATAASTGPAPAWRPAATQWEIVHARKFPIVGDGGGIWSFCHIDDAASATLAALERPVPGAVLNVCDDEPARRARVAARARAGGRRQAAAPRPALGRRGCWARTSSS